MNGWIRQEMNEEIPFFFFFLVNVKVAPGRWLLEFFLQVSANILALSKSVERKLLWVGRGAEMCSM